MLLTLTAIIILILDEFPPYKPCKKLTKKEITLKSRPWITISRTIKAKKG